MIELFEAGDAGDVSMGAGHYIRNTGSGPCRVLIGFNSGHYQSIDISAWLAGTPADALSTDLSLPREAAETLPGRTLFMAPPNRPR